MKVEKQQITSNESSTIKPKAQTRKKASLTEQLKVARNRNHSLKEQQDLLQENLQWHKDRLKLVETLPANPPTLLEYLATIDLSIFDEATATLIQRLQKRLAVM